MWALCLQMLGKASAATHHLDGRSSPCTPHGPSPQHRTSQLFSACPPALFPLFPPAAGHAHTAQTQRSHRGAAWSWDVQENLSRVQSHNLWGLNAARPTSNATRKGRHLDLPAAHPQPCHRPSQRTPAQCLSGHSVAVHWQTPQQPELGLVLFLYCFFTPEQWTMLYFLCQLAQVQSWHSGPYCSPDQGSFGLQTSLPA